MMPALVQRRTLRGRPAARPAFTITELMVTIGVVVMIVALLFPVVAAARQQAYDVRCKANLRAIHAGVQGWNVGKRPTARMRANGWMEQTFPHVERKMEVYSCPVSEFKLTSLDKSGKWVGTPPASAGGSTPSAADQPALPDVYAHIDAGGGRTWDVPLVEGPWVQKKNVTANSYELWLEDQGFLGGGDRDFKDVAMRITDNGDGTSTIEAIPLTKGKPGFASSVMAGSAGGAKTLYSDPYNSDGTPKPGTKVTVNGSAMGNNPLNPGGAGTESYQGGNSVPADYGFNDQAELVFGSGKKVLAMDYVESVVRTGADNWSDAKYLGGEIPNSPVFARHRGYANVLFGDGSVLSDRVSTTRLNPLFGANRTDFWAADGK